MESAWVTRTTSTHKPCKMLLVAGSPTKETGFLTQDFGKTSLDAVVNGHGHGAVRARWTGGDTTGFVQVGDVFDEQTTANWRRRSFAN